MNGAASSTTTTAIAPGLETVLMTGAFCHETPAPWRVERLLPLQRAGREGRVNVDVAVPGAAVVGVGIGAARGTPIGSDNDVAVTVNEDVGVGGATGFVAGGVAGGTVGIGMPPGICAVGGCGVVTDTNVAVEVSFVGPVGLETSHALLNIPSVAIATSIRVISIGPFRYPCQRRSS